MRAIERKIKDRIWKFAKDGFYPYRLKDSPLVLNINYDCIPDQKRALVCYLPQFFFQNIEFRTIGRTIPFEIFKIVRIFSELGYCIDIVPVNDLRSIEFIKTTNYSLIFGFGETFYTMARLQPKAVSVFYVTENHPAFSYREEKKRLDYFYERHKRKASISRSGRYYKASHVAVKYDHIIVMGEADQFSDQYENIHSINPTGFHHSGFVFKQKDHVKTRKHFLWLGSSAVIHKGLDLLIDILARRDDITLHICGLDSIGRELLKIPRKSNIVDYGFVNINSDIFLKIVEACSFSILPSCSEGMATSITTSMMHGLIPVVLRDTGFNRLGENAIFLDDYRIDPLDQEISSLADRDPEELAELSAKVYEFALSNFSTEAYERQMRSILEQILE